MYRREICVSKSIRPAWRGKEIYHFCIVLLCIQGQIPSTSPPGTYIRSGDLTEGFFALRFWGAYIWRGFYREGLIFGILRYLQEFPSQEQSAREMFHVRIYSFAECNGRFVIRLTLKDERTVPQECWRAGRHAVHFPVGRKEIKGWNRLVPSCYGESCSKSILNAIRKKGFARWHLLISL